MLSSLPFSMYSYHVHIITTYSLPRTCNNGNIFVLLPVVSGWLKSRQHRQSVSVDTADTWAPVPHIPGWPSPAQPWVHSHSTHAEGCSAWTMTPPVQRKKIDNHEIDAWYMCIKNVQYCTLCLCRYPILSVMAFSMVTMSCLRRSFSWKVSNTTYM